MSDIKIGKVTGNGNVFGNNSVVKNTFIDKGLIKRVKAAYLFENGSLAAIDTKGKQVPELQGEYSIKKHKRILLEATDDCEFKGFEILPYGFYRSAKSFADYFRNQNMSWDKIQSL